MSVIDAGGTFDGSAFAATATVAGCASGTAAASLEGVAPSLVYYSGTYTTTAQLDGLTPLAGAPTAPGSYTVLASFAGSTDYAPESVPGQLHHHPGDADGERHGRRRHV